MSNDVLKILVEKSDRISKDFLNLLNQCGFMSKANTTKLYCRLNELPVEIYFVRGVDIPILLENKFDVAITGLTSVLEFDLLEKKMEILKKLNYSDCRLSFAGKDFADLPYDLHGKTIATTYTNILSKYLKENCIDAKIIKMNGSVENSIRIGIADYIFDIVQTGLTLAQSGLVEILQVYNSEAVIIQKIGFKNDILNKILFRLDAVIKQKSYKYIMFNIKKNLLPKITKMLPSGKSPTILDLVDNDYNAVQTMCEEQQVWDICEKIKNIGATDILVMNIDLKFD